MYEILFESVIVLELNLHISDYNLDLFVLKQQFLCHLNKLNGNRWHLFRESRRIISGI